MSDSILIRRASAEELVDLRHVVLRAGLPRSEGMFAGDELPTTHHFAAERGNRIIGSATLFDEPYQGSPAWRLRGMAVADFARSLGIGGKLLAAIDAFILADGRTLQLWCNARTPARAFYERNGWRAVGEEFDIPTAGPHFVMEKRLSR